MEHRRLNPTAISAAFRASGHSIQHVLDQTSMTRPTFLRWMDEGRGALVRFDYNSLLAVARTLNTTPEALTVPTATRELRATPSPMQEATA